MGIIGRSEVQIAGLSAATLGLACIVASAAQFAPVILQSMPIASGAQFVATLGTLPNLPLVLAIFFIGLTFFCVGLVMAKKSRQIEGTPSDRAGILHPTNLSFSSPHTRTTEPLSPPLHSSKTSPPEGGQHQRGDAGSTSIEETLLPRMQREENQQEGDTSNRDAPPSQATQNEENTVQTEGSESLEKDSSHTNMHSFSLSDASKTDQATTSLHSSKTPSAKSEQDEGSDTESTKNPHEVEQETNLYSIGRTGVAPYSSSLKTTVRNRRQQGNIPKIRVNSISLADDDPHLTGEAYPEYLEELSSSYESGDEVSPLKGPILRPYCLDEIEEVVYESDSDESLFSLSFSSDSDYDRFYKEKGDTDFSSLYDNYSDFLESDTA